jgi:hypothetical protein
LYSQNDLIEILDIEKEMQLLERTLEKYANRFGNENP